MTGKQSGAEGEQDSSIVGSAAASIPEDILSLDHIFEALAHPRRRYLCYTLLDSTVWALEDLARKIAAWEKGVPEREVTNWHNDRVYAALYHSHVPKLVDLGVIEFDETTETIEPAENAKQVLEALEGMGDSLESVQESHARGDIDEQT